MFAVFPPGKDCILVRLHVSPGPLYPEAAMPRFVGRKTTPVWWDIIALVVLAIVVVVVLILTGVIHVFGS